MYTVYKFKQLNTMKGFQKSRKTFPGMKNNFINQTIELHEKRQYTYMTRDNILINYNFLI